MENMLETRVINLEEMANDLAQSMNLTSNVVSKLVNGIVPLVGNIVTEMIGGQIKEEFNTRAEEIENGILGKVGSEIDEKVKNAVNERGLNRSEMNDLTKARNIRMCQLLGDSKSDKYILLISFYQGAMVKGYRKQFNCSAYGDIEATRFKEALTYINNFDVDAGYYNWAIEKLHDQYRDGEIENRRKYNAYERFFGIRLN